jgi:photosystem II stability/assembly factor-like uncharacterized protein
LSGGGVLNVQPLDAGGKNPKKIGISTEETNQRLFFGVTLPCTVILGMVFLSACSGHAAKAGENSSGLTGTPVQLTATPKPTSSGSISIDVSSGSMKESITPGQSVSILQGNGEIDIVVHFPYPVDQQSVQTNLEQSDNLGWKLEVRNQPTSDSYSFILLGGSPGNVDVDLTPEVGKPTIKFSLQIQGSVPSNAQSVTLADDGTTLTLQVGQNFLLNLGADYEWTVSVADQTILSRLVNITVLRGAQGVYEAKQPGSTILTASGNPVCKGDQPPCVTPSRVFQVKIVVLSAPTATPFPLPPTQPALSLTKISMKTQLNGWAIGSVKGSDGEDVFQTIDGGSHWQLVTPPTIMIGNIIGFDFLDSNNAWVVVVGQNSSNNSNSLTLVVYRTTNEGLTWITSPPFSIKAKSLKSIDFIDQQHGWMLITLGAEADSEGVEIFESQDGGMTWESVSVSSTVPGQSTPQSLPLACIKGEIDFLDSSTGWVTGSCPNGKPLFYKTEDGGHTWGSQSLPVPSGVQVSHFKDCQCLVHAPSFLSKNTGILPVYVTGDQPGAFIYITSNGGKSWIPQSLPVINYLGGPEFIDDQEGWLTDGLNLYATYDGGKNWSEVAGFPTSNLKGGLNFVDVDHAWFTDGQQVYITLDGGKNWTPVTPALSIAPVPSTRTRIEFPRNRYAYTFSADLLPGFSQAYVLHVLAGQIINIMKNGEASFEVLDGQDNPVGGINATLGPWSIQATHSGDYTILLFGKGNLTMTVYIPPLSNTPSSSVPVPISQKRIKFAQGANSATITTDLVEGTPQGYLLMITAGQNLTIETKAMLNVAVLDPQNDPLSLESPQTDEWETSIPETGDYIIVVFGQGPASITMKIPPD